MPAPKQRPGPGIEPGAMWGLGTVPEKQCATLYAWNCFCFPLGFGASFSPWFQGPGLGAGVGPGLRLSLAVGPGLRLRLRCCSRRARAHARRRNAPRTKTTAKTRSAISQKPAE